MKPTQEESEKDFVKEFKEQKAGGDENPNQVDNADDLHEIQAGDDLGEPDPEANDLAPTEVPQTDENPAG